ncbi:unnamed protein product [Spodoptera littoralis]|uniref:Uncharacterized protein n=1 Tax=Spodoptera littoralis TaxID=7109 RepID=A0A9P0MYC5_SPOLI|nr:unnamed protein product [Spodoptera littoralis]CAH1635777.1 unnamed protein product [Spodoptera littoralis]
MKGVVCLVFHDNTRNMGEVRAYLHFLVICLYIAEHAVTPFVSVPWCDGSFPGYGYYDYGYFGDQPYATIEYDTPRPPLDVTSTTKPRVILLEIWSWCQYRQRLLHLLPLLQLQFQNNARIINGTISRITSHITNRMITSTSLTRS